MSVSVLTPAGRGAVATLLIRGDFRLVDEPPPLFRAANEQAVSQLPVGRVTFGRWGDAPGEEVVVCRTEPCELEIHCHGGAAAVNRILTDLAARGCKLAEESTAGNKDADLLERELLTAVSRATTLRTADILLQQQSGVLRQAFDALCACISRDERKPAIRQIDELLQWAHLGIHLTQPWKVVLCGRPNVGKSSLINALLGFSRAIVFDQPGTTRDVVTAETALQGWPVALSDTAGLREQADVLETVGIERAQRAIADADLRVVLIDASVPPQAEDQKLLVNWTDAIIVAHKSDLPSAWGDEMPAGAFAVSSLTGLGVDELAREISKRLVPEVPAPMTPVPVTMRQVTLLKEIRDLITRDAAVDEVEPRLRIFTAG